MARMSSSPTPNSSSPLSTSFIRFSFQNERALFASSFSDTNQQNFEGKFASLFNVVVKVGSKQTTQKLEGVLLSPLYHVLSTRYVREWALGSVHLNAQLPSRLRIHDLLYEEIHQLLL